MIVGASEQRVGPANSFAVSRTPARHRHGKSPHCHPEGQLAMVADGVLVVDVEGTSWIVPAGRIGWVPPGLTHSAKTFGAIKGWTFHLRPDLCDRLPAHPMIFRATDLTAALFNRIREWDGQQHKFTDDQHRLTLVFLDELAASESEALYLPMPADERLRRMAAAILHDPANKDDLETWASRIGMSERNLTRRFRTETNMSYVQWRGMVRMQRALEMLSGGATVTDTALDLGYDSPSSFIAKFRLTFGMTPSKRNVDPIAIGSGGRPRRR